MGELRPGGATVDLATWAGAIPQTYGVPPRIRIGRARWFNLLWLLPIGFVLLLIAVAVAKGLRTLPAVQHFIATYPGTVSTVTLTQNAGFPLWVAAQHFFNLFLLLFIIRAGWQILADHPRLYWTRGSTPGRDWFRFQKPVPPDPLWTAKQDSVALPGYVGLPGVRHSIGLARWWHLGLDTLWLFNGLIYYVLCFATPHWRRLVPTSWDVFPNAASVLLQYLSLHWPTESGWVAYNSLQLLAYFVTDFVAAPLALLTGLGMSPALSTRFTGVSRRLNIQVARSLHFLVMVWFVAFIVLHTALVATTDVLRNLNHIYLGRNDAGWGGFALFAVSLVVVAVAWVAASPFTLRYPRGLDAGAFALLDRWLDERRRRDLRARAIFCTLDGRPLQASYVRALAAACGQGRHRETRPPPWAASYLRRGAGDRGRARPAHPAAARPCLAPYHDGLPAPYRARRVDRDDAPAHLGALSRHLVPLRVCRNGRGAPVTERGCDDAEGG